MPSLPYYEIHSFADPRRRLSGNPAGVCLMDAYPDDETLLAIAESNNLSETAFVVPKGEDLWDLRWFTPALEVELCGHATLAAGAVLLEQGLVSGDTAQFDSRSGRLNVSRDAAAGFAMDLPRVDFKPAGMNAGLKAALGLADDPVEVLDIVRIHGAHYQMWVLASETDVSRCSPDHGRLKTLETNIIITAPGDEVDFVSRFFGPASGVDEDPVTGSAHCSLAPYWSDRLGKPRLSARQIGPRPGALEVQPDGGRVALFGQAPAYLEGRITF